MTGASILPRDSELFQRLHQAATERRCVFFAGLPGVGKSLLLQQLSLIAHESGRRVSLLQWDVARGPFETPELLARYPEVDGVTHAVIRKAAGLWTRGAVHQWDQQHADHASLLIGEVPLIGNRLIELVQRQADAVEALLASPRTLFFIPVPSREVRQAIEAARAREMATPAHERERANAVPSLVDALWLEVAEVGRQLGVPAPSPSLRGVHRTPDPQSHGAPPPHPSPPDPLSLHERRPPRGANVGAADIPSAARPSRVTRERGRRGGIESRAPDAGADHLDLGGGFDPELYASVYERLLRHRRTERLAIATVLPVQTSVYDALDATHDLVPGPEDVARIMAEVSVRPEAEIGREVADWFRV